MLPCQRHLFDLDPEVTYLNAAYMSPQLKSVTEAGMEALSRKSKPWTIEPADFFTHERALRETFAQLVEIDNPDQLALIPSASYGLTTAARNTPLSAGQEILVVDEQFPSNYYPWQRRAEETGATIRVVGPARPDRTTSWNEALLEAITPSTAVLAIGHIHWADGSLFDLVALRQKLNEVGAYLVIDGTQSVGALPFSVRDIQPDALVVAGYKWLLGPYSLGLAYFGERYLTGTPLEENWIARRNSEQFGGLVEYEPDYQPGAARFSVGEKSNFNLVPMLHSALQQLLEWQPARIQDYCADIAREALEELAEMGCYLEPTERRAHHLYGIRLPRTIDADRLAESLSSNRVYVSRRGSALRISPHLYNTADDFRALVGCFRSALLAKST
jgi:selenocysteine lyase/cysteine desulfurase